MKAAYTSATMPIHAKISSKLLPSIRPPSLREAGRSLLWRYASPGERPDALTVTKILRQQTQFLRSPTFEEMLVNGASGYRLGDLLGPPAPHFGQNVTAITAPCDAADDDANHRNQPFHPAPGKGEFNDVA
jgi:hypothetical protein